MHLLDARQTGARRAALALVALAALCLPRAAAAHATQLSSARAVVAAHEVNAVLELNARDLEVALGIPITDAGGNVATAAVGRTGPTIAAYVLARVRVSNASGGACRGRVEMLEAKADHLLVRGRWRCAPLAGALVYESTLFHEIDAAARHVFTASGDVRRMALLSVSSPRVTLVAAAAGLGDVLLHYARAGVEHIAAGYDHIAFLLAVIVWGRRLWPLVGVVTAFTVAHSVTLTLAVLDLVVVPARLVETLIALSIVYVAAENFFVRDLRRRWILTLVFGLIHGLGFAAVLRDYGLPREALAAALAAFNLGVEAGQLLVVATALVALRALERVLPARVGAQLAPRLPLALSAMILGLGIYWTALRLSAH
jgi:hypothetical protein